MHVADSAAQVFDGGCALFAENHGTKGRRRKPFRRRRTRGGVSPRAPPPSSPLSTDLRRLLAIISSPHGGRRSARTRVERQDDAPAASLTQ
jgi:hypothetical protein